jgi:hypothetical protein
MDDILRPQVLADDLAELHRTYAAALGRVQEPAWDRRVKGSAAAWSLHETLAHLGSLNGSGLDCVTQTLDGQPYAFEGLEDRYRFNSFVRKGIDGSLGLPVAAMSGRVLDILERSAAIARDLRPDQAALTSRMWIYNRPTRIDEAFSIITLHTGLAHSAQVAEPLELAPLWTQLSTEFRHRVIGRTMLAFAMLYRTDLGGDLRETMVFRVDGPEGGEWHVALAPEGATWGEGGVDRPGLVIRMPEASTFFRMVTSRVNVPLALVRREIRLRGNVRLFLNMGRLTSVDATP